MADTSKTPSRPAKPDSSNFDPNMPTTREIVELSHLLVLGRTPRTEHQMTKSLACGTLSMLRESLLSSKALDVELKRLAKRPFVVFIHIPKAAGTFLKFYFNSVYGPDRCAWLSKKLIVSDALKPSQYLVAGGHTPFDAAFQQFKDRNPVFISVVRHPIARAVSYYNFLRTQTDHPSHDRLHEMTLFQAITTDKKFRNQCDRDQIRFLSGTKDLETLKEIVEANSFIIGKQERLDDFMLALHEQLRLPIVTSDFRRSNAAAPGYLAEIAAQPRYEEAIDLIAQLNKDELELYNSFDSVWTSAPRHHRLAQKNSGKIASGVGPSHIGPASRPTPEIVALAHHILFDRPATKPQITKGLKCGTISLMRETLLNSAEFEESSKKLANRPFLFFIHIPKTAGGSLRKYFKTVFGPRCQWYLRNQNVEDRPVMRSDAPFDVERHLAKYRITGGHIQFDDIPSALIEKTPILVSVIRNPVQRVLSYYNYVRTEEGHPARERILQLTLFEALTKDKRFAAQCDRSQIRFLCGTTDLGTLKRTLEDHRFIIGKQEFMDDFMETLHKELGLPRIPVHSTQVHKSAPDYVAQIAAQPNYDEAIQIISAQNADEFTFYNSFGAVRSNRFCSPD